MVWHVGDDTPLDAMGLRQGMLQGQICYLV